MYAFYFLTRSLYRSLNMYIHIFKKMYFLHNEWYNRLLLKFLFQFHQQKKKTHKPPFLCRILGILLLLERDEWMDTYRLSSY